jgi:hypothetical protein
MKTSQFISKKEMDLIESRDWANQRNEKNLGIAQLQSELDSFLQKHGLTMEEWRHAENFDDADFICGATRESTK